MSIARPAAEIEPQAWMFSSNWILPGPIRPSASRSIRTLSCGSGPAGATAFNGGALTEESGLAPDLAIEALLARIMAHIATEAFYEQDEPSSYPITTKENPGQA